MKPCRVCKQPVIPWRRGWRRPHTTIHERCLSQPCRFCGVVFRVAKERRGLFCCNAHQGLYRAFGTAENLARLDAR